MKDFIDLGNGNYVLGSEIKYILENSADINIAHDDVFLDCSYGEEEYPKTLVQMKDGKNFGSSHSTFDIIEMINKGDLR